jgi:hypothetical protein
MIDRFAPGAAIANDRFGHAVALDGFTGAVGATTDSVNALSAASAGSTWVYQFQYNLGPRLTFPVSDQLAAENTPFGFTVDPAIFDDPVYPGTLVVAARLATGNPLPGGGWLAFNPLTRTFTGTPTPSNRDDYELVLVASNQLGTTLLSNVFRIVVAPAEVPTLQSAYAAWSSNCFSPAVTANPALEASVWGMSANSDGDAYGNLLEMLFGTLPGQSDPSQLTFQKLGGAQVSLTFPMANDFPMTALHVEWSSDMNHWSRESVVMTSHADLNGLVWVTAVVTPPSPQLRLFVRLAVGP